MLDASAAVTLLTTPRISRMPSAADNTSASEATKVTANEAANHHATRVRVSTMMRNRPMVIIEKQHSVMTHRIGRNTRYGKATAATSIGMHSHCIARNGSM